MSLQEALLTVPAEQRARFLARAELVAARARACQCSQVELELALRVLSVLCGAAPPSTRGSNS